MEKDCGSLIESKPPRIPIAKARGIAAREDKLEPVMVRFKDRR